MKVVGKIISISELSVKVLLMDDNVQLRDILVCKNNDKEYKFEVVELEENSRISDAIDKAEGLKENADTKNINLAFKLEDGMKIYIPTIGESIAENEVNENNNMIDETSKYVTSASGVAQEENNGQTEEKKSEKVNINKATQTELEGLPGIGPATAIKIINYRNENGKFKNIEDIKEVSGIGDAKYENIKDLICVE